MQKIIASKSTLAICLTVDLLCTVALIVGLFFLADAIACGEGSQIVAWSMLSGGLALSLCGFLFGTNRLGCIVSLDGACVKRRGFFFGFQKVCKLQEIQKISVVDMERFGKMIVLIDEGSVHGLDFARQNSWICFEYNEKNIAALQSVWQGEIALS